MFGSEATTLIYDYQKCIITSLAPPKLRGKVQPSGAQENPPQDMELESVPSINQTQRVPLPSNQPAPISRVCDR